MMPLESQVDMQRSTPLPAAEEQELLNRPALRRVPPIESGFALMGFGVVGVLFLDPFDAAFVLVGALALTPPLFVRTEQWFESRFPKAHNTGRRQLDRFLDDLDRRFPPRPR